MNKYFLENAKQAPLISQKGVKHYTYPERNSHNAIWDSNTGPDGRFYYALASEIATSGYVRFCVYDYSTNDVQELFKVEDVILPTDRSIRASKFHSSICFMPNGKIVMTSHTTDKSPRHPTWMPYAYYHHLWEGFSGGQIVVYDPATNKAESLGTPVPHETIYGSVYCDKNNSLYFLGMMRGGLYRYSFDEKSVYSLGKVSENYSFRLAQASDGNIYAGSRTGWLFKVEVDTDTIVDLNYQTAHAPMDYTTMYNMPTIARTGPDGRLYLASMYSRSIYAVDTSTGEVEDMGWYLPTERYAPEENRHGVFGMDFDSKGNLWYAVSSLNNFNGTKCFGIPASLFRWDIAGGDKPEWCGLIGTPERGGSWISEIAISKDNILYAANTNHALDGPSIIAINLDEFVPSMQQKSELLQDDYFVNPHFPRYEEAAEMIIAEERIMEANPCEAQIPCLPPVLLWRALAPGNIENSTVKALAFDENGLLYGVCGSSSDFFFTIEQGQLKNIVPLEKADRAKAELVMSDKNVEISSKAQLPYYPGRQYKAVVSATAELSAGRIIAGTQDGLVAIVKGDAAYALGPAAVNGPVHQWAKVPGKDIVYGVVGDEQDIPTLVRYDDDNGLRQLGFFANIKPANINEVFYLADVRSIAISPCGRYMAVGSCERMGTVVVYKLA